jgi:hypothetical protein
VLLAPPLVGDACFEVSGDGGGYLSNTGSRTVCPQVRSRGMMHGIKEEHAFTGPRNEVAPSIISRRFDFAHDLGRAIPLVLDLDLHTEARVTAPQAESARQGCGSYLEHLLLELRLAETKVRRVPLALLDELPEHLAPLVLRPRLIFEPCVECRDALALHRLVASQLLLDLLVPQPLELRLVGEVLELARLIRRLLLLHFRHVVQHLARFLLENLLLFALDVRDSVRCESVAQERG